MSKNKKLNNTRQSFLLSFFDVFSEYDEKEINGFWLVKHWNGNNNSWEVAIYSKEAYENYKKYKVEKLNF